MWLSVCVCVWGGRVFPLGVVQVRLGAIQLAVQWGRGLPTVLSILSVSGHWKLKVQNCAFWWSSPAAPSPTLESLSVQAPRNSWSACVKPFGLCLGQESQWGENKRESDSGSEKPESISPTYCCQNVNPVMKCLIVCIPKVLGKFLWCPQFSLYNDVLISKEWLVSPKVVSGSSGF